MISSEIDKIRILNDYKQRAKNDLPKNFGINEIFV